MGYAPPHPAHAGIGLPSTPGSLPVPPHRQSGTGPGGGFVKEAKTTSLFVGSIAPGTDDATLTELLNVSCQILQMDYVLIDRLVDHYIN